MVSGRPQDLRVTGETSGQRFGWLPGRSVASGFVSSVSASDPLPTVLSPQAGVQVLPQRRGTRPVLEGDKGLAQGCAPEAAVESEVGRRGAFTGVIGLQACLFRPLRQEQSRHSCTAYTWSEWPSPGRKPLHSHVLSSKPSAWHW